MTRGESAARAAWCLLALTHLAPGVAGMVWPEWFATELAGMPAGTPHFARDVGAAELTLAVGAALAAVRPAVRLAVAAVLGVHLVLHAVSHLVDHAVAAGGANALIAVTLLVQGLLLAVGAGWLPPRGRLAEQPPGLPL